MAHGEISNASIGSAFCVPRTQFTHTYFSSWTIQQPAKQACLFLFKMGERASNIQAINLGSQGERKQGELNMTSPPRPIAVAHIIDIIFSASSCT